jgi:hypothetical protein
MHQAKWAARAAAKKLRDDLILADYDAGVRVRDICSNHHVSTTTVYDLVNAFRSNHWGKARDYEGVFKWNGKQWVFALKWELQVWLGPVPIRWTWDDEVA